jgi:hypothetical protein
MSIRNQTELEITYAKIGFLQGACDALQHQPGCDVRVDQRAMQSLQSQIRELQTAISLYEKNAAHVVAA